jgi:hypothetical protein
MPQSNRTFRIFVSSTFSDLKAERNALQAHVFLRLRELCEGHSARQRLEMCYPDMTHQRSMVGYFNG